MADKLKLMLALLIMIAGIAGYYYFAEANTLYRALGVVAATLVALGVASLSTPGRVALRFMRDSRTEVRKVVWPTRKETSQTTLIVIVVVFVVGIILWVLDMGLLWSVKLLTGQGS